MKIDILDLIHSYLLDLDNAEYESIETYKKDISALIVLVWTLKRLLKEK